MSVKTKRIVFTHSAFSKIGPKDFNLIELQIFTTFQENIEDGKWIILKLNEEGSSKTPYHSCSYKTLVLNLYSSAFNCMHVLRKLRWSCNKFTFHNRMFVSYSLSIVNAPSDNSSPKVQNGFHDLYNSA